MKEELEQRLIELVDEGQRLVSSLPRDKYGPQYWVQEGRIAEYQKWLGSTANLLILVDQSNGVFASECDKLMNDKDHNSGISSRIVQKMHGLLTSAQEEWKRGLLRKVEYLVTAEAFDDFLDHASVYHKGNKKTESSVLASAVLEDTIKKIANKNNIDSKGKSLDPLIDELVKNEVITPVKAKRIKGFAAVRNHALHAEWEEFDIKDVGQLISGVRELIDSYL